MQITLLAFGFPAQHAWGSLRWPPALSWASVIQGQASSCFTPARIDTFDVPPLLLCYIMWTLFNVTPDAICGYHLTCLHVVASTILGQERLHSKRIHMCPCDETLLDHEKGMQGPPHTPHSVAESWPSPSLREQVPLDSADAAVCQLGNNVNEGSISSQTPKMKEAGHKRPHAV